MRTLITGGAGFMGSHLCERFIERGHEVVCVDNFITGIAGKHRALCGITSASAFIRHDISHPLEIDGPIDNILHFASPASPVDYLKFPIQTLKVGSLGTHNTLGLAKAKNARYLLASTSEVYGDPEVHPQREDYWGHVNPIGLRGCYDESKRFAEAIVMAYHRAHGVDTRIIRIFNTYGTRMRLDDGRVLPNFMGQALRGEPLTIYGDGSQTRSFCYVEDLVNGIEKLLFTDFHEPVNLGNPDEVTILQFAQRDHQAVRQHEHDRLPSTAPGRPARAQAGHHAAPANCSAGSRSSAREEGLRRTLAYFQAKVEQQARQVPPASGENT